MREATESRIARVTAPAITVPRTPSVAASPRPEKMRVK
jgi:hypothetical protein